LAGAAVATERATAADDTLALTFPPPMLRRLLAGDAALRAALGTALLAGQRSLERRLESLLLHGVESRLASFILEAAGRWGQPRDAGELVTAPFTHAEIAELIGSTRETVTLLLGKLRREGHIELQRRRVVLRDRAALARRSVAVAD